MRSGTSWFDGGVVSNAEAGEGGTYTYDRLYEFSFDEFENARVEDLVNRFLGRKIDVLDDIRPVDERRVCEGDCEDGKKCLECYFLDGPIAVGRLLVAITRTFFLCLSLSSCVRSALTTCMSCVRFSMVVSIVLGVQD